MNSWKWLIVKIAEILTPPIPHPDMAARADSHGLSILAATDHYQRHYDVVTSRVNIMNHWHDAHHHKEWFNRYKGGGGMLPTLDMYLLLSCKHKIHFELLGWGRSAQSSSPNQQTTCRSHLIQQQHQTVLLSRAVALCNDLITSNFIFVNTIYIWNMAFHS